MCITDNVDAVAASLAWAAPTQPLFNGCAEFDVGRRHFWCDFAVLDEGQNALEPSEVLNGRASLGALRGGALSSSRYRALGEFGLRIGRRGHASNGAFLKSFFRFRALARRLSGMRSS